MLVPLRAKVIGRRWARTSHKQCGQAVWEWKQPLTKDKGWRDAAWCALLEQPSLLEEVPLESAPA